MSKPLPIDYSKPRPVYGPKTVPAINPMPTYVIHAANPILAGQMFGQGLTPTNHPVFTKTPKRWSPSLNASVAVPVFVPAPVGASQPAAKLIIQPEPADIAPSQATTGKPLVSIGTESHRMGIGNQGQVPDCWMVAAMNSLALMRPDLLLRIVLRNSDGTFQTTFQTQDYVDGNWTAYYPVTFRCGPNISPIGSAPDPLTGAIITPMLEKILAMARLWLSNAFTNHAPAPNTYASIGEGSPDELIMWLFNVPSTYILPANLANFAFAVDSYLGSWIPGCVCTNSTTTVLIPGHCYTVVEHYVKNGIHYFVLQNPWGGDTITITGTDMENDVEYGVFFTGLPPRQPSANPDPTGSGYNDLGGVGVWKANIGYVGNLGANSGDFLADGTTDLADFEFWLSKNGTPSTNPV